MAGGLSPRALLRKAVDAVPALRPAFLHIYKIRKGPDTRTVAFDECYGIDTSGFIPAWLLNTDGGSLYYGCHPEAVRRCLDLIPEPGDFHFYDMGCGKGRAMVLATEYAFRGVTGVEIDTALAADARRNLDIIAAAFPKRTRTEVVEGDAATLPIDDGDVVLFVYHGLPLSVLQAILDRQAGRAGLLLLIYENPVHGHALDSRADLHRWHARRVAENQASSEGVIIWANRPEPFPGRAPPGGRDREIKMLIEDYYADLIPL